MPLFIPGDTAPKSNAFGGASSWRVGKGAKRTVSVGNGDGRALVHMSSHSWFRSSHVRGIAKFCSSKLGLAATSAALGRAGPRDAYISIGSG